MKQQTLNERRGIIGRLMLQMTNKQGPLTQSERDNLRSLRLEADEIEADIGVAFERRKADAFRSYIRYGWSRQLSDEHKKILSESRDLSTGGAYPGSVSGQFVPLDFQDRVTSAQKDASAMTDLATIVSTATGAIYPWPLDDDTPSVGEYVSENTQVTSQDVQNITSANMRSWIVSSKIILVSNQLVEDQQVDLENYLAGRFGARIARVTNPKYTNGSGTNEPQGVLTAASSAGTAVGASPNDGASGANSLGVGDFATLEAAVDPSHRGNSSWMLHPNTLSSLRSARDKQGAVLFPGLHSGGQDMIFNRPIRVNGDMDQLQSNANSPAVSRTVLAFGDFSRYLIRRVNPMMFVMRQRFADQAKTGYLMLWRQDGRMLDAAAVKTLSTLY